MDVEVFADDGMQEEKRSLKLRGEILASAGKRSPELRCGFCGSVEPRCMHVIRDIVAPMMICATVLELRAVESYR